MSTEQVPILTAELEALRHRIATLEKAIRDADSWLQCEEGVSLPYYSNCEDRESVRLIESLLEKPK